MSNFLAIATVTAGLRQLLAPVVAAAVPGATVTTVRPDATMNAASQAGVNIYLYQVTTNAAFRSADLPIRSTSGQIIQRPQVALNLNYLLTFHGDESQLETQRLLGSVVSMLYANPVLTRDTVQKTVTNPSFAPFLATSNLAEA